MAGGHGGARANAGRKPRRIKYSAKCNKLDKKLADHVEQAAANLIRLADGGYERVTQVWKPAGTIQITETEVVETERGPKVLRTLRPAFPDLEDQTTLVCVERKVEIAEPDRAANEYIIDRIAGTPQAMEEPETDPKGAAKASDESRKAAMEKMKSWRQQSAAQLDSIRNPLTGATMAENESTNEDNTPLDSGTMDEF